MKKTLAEPMPEKEGNDNKTKNEKNLPNSNSWNSTGINSKNEKNLPNSNHWNSTGINF